MDAILSYIKPELLVLVPVLYFLGAGLKKAEAFPDNRIPLVLGVAGILLAALYVAATQGILTAGCSVYVNQLIKQQEKGE